MTKRPPTPAVPGEEMILAADGGKAINLPAPNDLRAKIYQAISVQRPAVLAYLKSLRRDNPNATPAELLKILDKRYVATVTIASTGVGTSAAIPAVGIPLALGLGVTDLLFFYETSALYVLAATELHGIEVSDVARTRPLIFGMLLGKKSQSRVTKLVFRAAGAGGIERARTAVGTVGRALPNGWGEVLTQQLPDSALAPLAAVLAREALTTGAKFGAGTLGKAIPFGFGALIGGVGSFTFGRDVVKAARIAFPKAPTHFPEALLDFQKEPGTAGISRAVKALQSTASTVTNFSKDTAKIVGSMAKGAAKNVGSAAKGAATGTAGAVGSLLKRKREGTVDAG